MNDLLPRSEAMEDQVAPVGDEDVDEVWSPENLRPFLEEVGLLKEEMTTIRELLAHLKAANEESKTVIKQDERRAVRDRIKRHIWEFLNSARHIRERLEVLERANVANRSISGCGEGSTCDRCRTSVTNSLRKKLKKLVMDFERLRRRIMSGYREEVERSYFTLTGQFLPEDVVENMILDGNSEVVLTRGSCSSGQHRVIETLREIEHRPDAAKELEESLIELRRLFLDMAVLVDSHDEMTDNIENHVSSAAQYITEGTKELECAKNSQRSNRKWLRTSILLLLILVLLVVIIAFTSQFY